MKLITASTLAAIAAIGLVSVLPSCITATGPDGVKTTRVDLEAFKLGTEVVKAYAPARGTVQVVPEK